jgi:SsrA-binding protein
MNVKVISKNRRASHDYELGDTFEAGLQLVGTEVKALRAAKVNLTDGWVDIDNGEAWLKDAHIGLYSHGNIMNHFETRPRRLLLHKREIAKLSRITTEKGLTVVPTQIYFSGAYVKVEIAVAKGKKAYDKREANKAREANREIERAMKRR